MTAASRGFYSENAVCFDIYGVESGAEARDISQEFFTLLQSDEIKDIVIWINDFKQLYTYGTYFSDKPYELPVTSGRYFEKGDFFCGKNLALNVECLSRGAIEKDGKKLYPREQTGVLYESIGSVGYPTISSLDITAIVNLDSFTFTTEGGMFGLIDGPSKSAVRRNIKLISDFFIQRGMRVEQTSTPIPSFTVSDFLGVETLNLVMYLFAIYTVVLSTAPLTIYWVWRRRQAVAVKRMLGLGAFAIVAQMYGRLFVIFNIGFVTGAAAMALIKLLDLTAQAGISAAKLAGAYALSLIFSILVSIVPLIKTLRIEPGDALRKDV